MKRSALLQNMNINLDLALEAHAALQEENKADLSGVALHKELQDDITVTTLEITNEEGAQSMGRPCGQYITIEAPSLMEHTYAAHKEIAQILAQKLSLLLPLPDNASFLVVGLGNRQATPDALGPKVTEQILVSRHLFDYVPREIEGELRNVSAISPGVLGLTGIETVEVLRGLVEHIRPDCLIAIDALATSSLERIGVTIQLTNTGINPGSGIGNHRKGITQENLGCPVLAIGVPTVVNAAILVHETLEELLAQLEDSSLLALSPAENEGTILGILEKTLAPFRENLMVTPKEIDHLIDKTSHLIAGGLNIFLHPGINGDNFETYQIQ